MLLNEELRTIEEGNWVDLLPAWPWTALLFLTILIGLHLGLGRLLGKGTFAFLSTMIALTSLGIVFILLTLTRDVELGPDELQILAAILIGTLGLASTTIIGNALAGVQLRAVRAFKLGDFLKIGEHFGRVTERGLFHTEIQTEFADLTTFPNLFLVNNPYRVVQKRGTIVTANVSLGYDIPRPDVDACLKEAALAAELKDPFVQVVELGDFSVTYKVGGMYENVKHVLTCRSNLRRRIMDSLFAAGYEIASPTLMDTRAKQPNEKIIPPDVRTSTEEEEEAAPMENVAFQKADEIEATAPEAEPIRPEDLAAKTALDEKSSEEDQAATSEPGKGNPARTDDKPPKKDRDA